MAKNKVIKINDQEAVTFSQNNFLMLLNSVTFKYQIDFITEIYVE
jgi:hypothetical protein